MITTLIAVWVLGAFATAVAIDLDGDIIDDDISGPQCIAFALAATFWPALIVLLLYDRAAPLMLPERVP